MLTNSTTFQCPSYIGDSFFSSGRLTSMERPATADAAGAMIRSPTRPVNRPVSTPRTARTIGPSHMFGGASWGDPGGATRAKKGRKPTSPATTTLVTPAATAITRNTGETMLASYTSSLPMKPTRGGTPAMESPARPAATAVTGIAARSPPSTEMSRVPVSWSMAPATRNSAPL